MPIIKSMKICITGKPCSGKTLAMSYIKDLGYNTWIADDFVKKIYKVNKPGYNLIKREFGSKFVTKKDVNRKALGSLVFANKKALIKLNKIMNPLIRKAITKLPNKKTWFIELGTYIFYPQDFRRCFDKIVLIFNNQIWKKSKQGKKFSYLKKIPTFFVEKSKKSSYSILNIDGTYCQREPINVDIFVNNCKSKNFLRSNILKICELLK